MINTIIYRKKDGTVSTIKNNIPGGSYSYGPDWVMKGSSIKTGYLTTFNDASFNPKKFGVKMGNKTTYFSPTMKPYK
jgi:hypothetical protein